MREEIKTRRLRLRPLARRDAAKVAELIGAWEVVSQLARPPYPYALRDAIAYIEALERRVEETGLRDYAITRDGAVIGVVGVGAGAGGAALGYWLGRPYWGQGTMSEAARAVVEAFFADDAGDKLTSGVFEGNDASLAIQAKLGFEVVGRSRMVCRARGVEVAHVNTEVTRDRFVEFAT